MYIEFGYGNSSMEVRIEKENLLDVLLPFRDAATTDAAALIEAALDRPIGSPPLSQLVKRGQKIAVIISDVTRPCPSYKILPPLLERLLSAGVDPRDVTIVSGLGSHRPQTELEKQRLVGSYVFKKYAVEDSCDSGYVVAGTSSRGTVYEVCRTVLEADVRIAVGNIDYHYFAGYSGGAKALMPGVCSRRSIEQNHTMMLRQGARAGQIQGNPVRADIDEVLRFISLDFLVNVVLNDKKEIVAAVCGDAIEAHRAGCAALDELYKCPIDRLADIVITSVGGQPKDINVYQTQKALDNAKWAVREGGTIILVGECAEGYGEKTFAAWLEAATCPQDLIDRIGREFRLGGHKAAAIAAVAKKHDIYLVSSLSEEQAGRLFMKPFSSLQAAYDDALERLGPQATVYCLPAGGSTLPYLR